MTAGDVVTIIEDSVAKKGNYFDGTDDYVLHDAHAAARVAANDTTGTYTAWVYVTDTTSRRVILSAGDNDSANEYLRLSIETLGNLQITLKQGGANQFVIYSTNSVPVKTWTHVAVVQDGVQPLLYIDGVLCNYTNATATDKTMWYDELANCDKFAIGVLESNGTHTEDWLGAIGQVKYWYRALSAAEIMQDFQGSAQTNAEYPDSTYLVFNVTMDTNGTTDSGTGADNGTLTGNAHYGGYISQHSIALEAVLSGHAAEYIQTIKLSPNKLMTIVKKGD